MLSLFDSDARLLLIVHDAPPRDSESNVVYLLADLVETSGASFQADFQSPFSGSTYHVSLDWLRERELGQTWIEVVFLNMSLDAPGLDVVLPPRRLHQLNQELAALSSEISRANRSGNEELAADLHEAMAAKRDEIEEAGGVVRYRDYSGARKIDANVWVLDRRERG